VYHSGSEKREKKTGKATCAVLEKRIDASTLLASRRNEKIREQQQLRRLRLIHLKSRGDAIRRRSRSWENISGEIAASFDALKRHPGDHHSTYPKACLVVVKGKI